MKLNFRKIASVLASTVMLSSTVALAAAANYPAPFVQGGNANVAVVYGSAAAITDVVAAGNVQSELQAKLAEQTATGTAATSGSSVSGGDFVKLAKPSDNVNLRDSVSTVFGSSVTDDDLPELLKDGTYTNDENTDFKYEQRITLGSGLILNYFKDSDYNDEEPSVGINLTTSQLVTNYSLDFTTDAESDISGGDLVDLETTVINILGKEYYISDVDNSTLDITLLDTANSALVSEGETQTVTVGDKSYEVSISYISTTEVKLNVNGQETNSLGEGTTYKLSDGTYVGIKDILARDVQGVVGKVEFSLGSGKLELRNGATIEINDKSVQEITSEIRRGSAGSSGRERIDRINLVWITDDDAFVTSTSSLTLPGFENLKLSTSAFVAGTEVTKVGDGSSDYVQVETVLKDGDVKIPILYANSSGEFTGIGKSSSERLVVTPNATLTYNHTAGDRMFIASYNTSSDAESYLLRFSEFENDAGTNRTSIQKYVNGAWDTNSGGVCADRKDGDTCTIGSLTLTIGTVSQYPDRTVNITGNTGSSFHRVYTKGGLLINLPFSNTYSNDTYGSGQAGQVNFTVSVAGRGYDSVYLNFTEENKDDALASGGAFSVTLNDNTDGGVEVSGITTGKTTLTDPDDTNHILSMVYSDHATLVELMGQSSDRRDATITYSPDEAFADVILSTEGAIVSSGESTSSGSVKVLGSVAVSDSEVSSVSSRNLVVVGGSCINSVAASLLGGAYCGADFTAKTGIGAGQFLIQTFSRSGGNVATLVAGYNAADTLNGAKYLTSQTVDTTVGKKYKGTSATSATLEATSA